MDAECYKLNDAHCHMYAFGNMEQIDHALAMSKNIDRICENATSPDNFDTVISISQRHPNRIIPSIGVHPCNYKDWNGEVKKRMEELLAGNLGFMVGEIGLDFIDKTVDKKKQTEVLRGQIELATRYKRTASIHSVRSHGEMLKLLKKMFKEDGEAMKSIHFVMHSYSGPVEIMKSMLKLSDKILFSLSLGSITSNNKTVLESLPLSNILVETDSPYQLVEDLEGLETVANFCCKDIKGDRLNLPANIHLLARHIASVRKLDLGTVVQHLNDNFNRAFQSL